MNNCTKIGTIYRINDGTVAASILNMPSDANVGSALIHVESPYPGIVTIQTFKQAQGEWRRVYNNNAWGSWARNYDETILNDSTILSPLASALGVEQVSLGAVTQGQTINIPFKDFVGCVLISANTSGIWAVVVFDNDGVTVIQKGSRCDSFLSFSVSAPGYSPSAWNLVVSVLSNISTGIYYKRL